MSRTTEPTESATMIARRRNLALHQVQYVVKTYRIRPSERFGHVNVFDQEGVQRIERELDRIEARKALAGRKPAAPETEAAHGN